MKHNEQTVQDSVAENYESLRYHLPYARRYHDWWLAAMLKLVDPPNRRGRVLDNGCGTGMLFDYVEDARLIVGLDLSAGMLDKARKYGVNLVQGDSLSLPYRDGEFDLVLARSLVHHLPDPEAGIREMARVLRPGGQLVLADTNYSVLSAVPRLLAYRRENFSEVHQNLHYKDYVTWLERYVDLKMVRFFGYVAYPFGFPDMMGPFARLKYPSWLVSGLIRLDNVIAAIPWIRTQSWGVMAMGIK